LFAKDAAAVALLGVFGARAEGRWLGSIALRIRRSWIRRLGLWMRRFFDAYNRCDLVKFSSFFVEDVEFYHDQGGVTLGRQNLTDSVKKNICGKTTRELVPGTLQVHYMKGYGAVEMGVHRFRHPGHEDTEGVVRGDSFTCGSTRMGLEDYAGD